MIDTPHAKLKIFAVGGDIMKRVILKLIQLILKKVIHKKQPQFIKIEIENIILIINKD